MSAQRGLVIHGYILGQLAAGPGQVGVPTLGLPGPTLTQAQSVMEKTVPPRTVMAPK